MESIDVLGYVAGILVVISLLPQTIKSWKTKSTQDLSLWRYIIYVVGLIIWIIYAIKIDNGPVAVMNGLGLILAISILYLKLKYGIKDKYEGKNPNN
ncbi:MAG: SemiSWEET family sugar transporter [Candidatus Kerfeldbacteria bacterium]